MKEWKSKATLAGCSAQGCQTCWGGEGRMAVDVASSFVWQLGEWAAGRAAGSALGPPEGCAHAVTHRYDRLLS